MSSTQPSARDEESGAWLFDGAGRLGRRDADLVWPGHLVDAVVGAMFGLCQLIGGFQPD